VSASGRRGRRRVEPTDEWELLVPLFEWPEQESYEEIRPLVLFGSSVAERAEEVGTSASTLYRRMDRFEIEGMESLFDSRTAKRRRLPPSIRRLIVELKAEHPPLSLGEIASICYVRFGRRPSKHTVGRVLSEEPIPLKMMKRFDPYHQIPQPTDRRLAVVSLHSEGWSAKSIAGYLRTHKSTVYRVLKRWIEEGEEGLEDRPHGRPKGVRKVTLKDIEAVRRLQQNPELGEFRVHAALAQMGIHLSPATCGRIMALNRRLYGYGKSKGGPRQKKQMPFASSRRHQYWTIDVRYVDRHRVGGKVYAISILENHSRAILASAISLRQDLTSYLSVLYAAVEHYGSPETIVTDGGAIFCANQANAIYEALGIAKEEIERGKPWQSYIETTFNIQRRMADWHFARASSVPELVAVHDGWVDAYNHQSHWAHRERKDGRRCPLEVLGWVSGRRHEPEKLARAFFSTRFARTLDQRGYARFRHWLIYGNEGLARCEAALWLSKENLTVEYAGEPLSHYEVEYVANTGRLREVKNPTLFETTYALPQLRLFELDDTEWLKALKVGEYALRRSWRPQALQEVLFSYTEAL
jgi:putative transposase